MFELFLFTPTIDVCQLHEISAHEESRLVNICKRAEDDERPRDLCRWNLDECWCQPVNQHSQGPSAGGHQGRASASDQVERCKNRAARISRFLVVLLSSETHRTKAIKKSYCKEQRIPDEALVKYPMCVCSDTVRHRSRETMPEIVWQLVMSNCGWKQNLQVGQSSKARYCVCDKKYQGMNKSSRP